jgi:glycyl-tRNA synthetase beta chain
MPQLLLELLSEEIPARMQANAARDLERLAREKLAAAGLLPEALATFGGSRRLTLVAEGLPGAQADRSEERKGPRTNAPDQAIEGFLRSTGLARADLVERDGVYFATLSKKGRPTPAIVAEMVEAIVREFPWPKSMVSGVSRLRWVRPLRRILCVFDGEIVPFNIDGIESGDTTEGHRFMGSGQPFKARDYDAYAAGLAKHYVVLDPQERKDRILADATTLCAARNLELVEDAGLLDEVAGLVEWPVPVLGDMDPAFLDLPPEVIRTSMRVHQRFFAVRDPSSGKLAPHFLTVANVDAVDGGRMIAKGNAKVLSARLADARFFWEEDLRVPLEQLLDNLNGVTFHARLGTMRERVARIEELSIEIARHVGVSESIARQAARLAKSDLTSGMVREFPELQGHMGRYYYRARSGLAVIGVNDASIKARLPDSLDQSQVAQEAILIADAIRDHYKPLGAHDEVPTAALSAVVSLADKLDTLAGFFAIGERPTGSRDPFALRRAALGVIRIILDGQLRLKLRGILLQAAANLGREDEHGEIWIWGYDPQGEVSVRHPGLIDSPQTEVDPGKVASDVLSFFADRLKVQLRDEGQRHDLVDAVFALGDDDLVRIVARVQALAAFLGAEDGKNLLAGYKRAVNILKAEEKKTGLPAGEPTIMDASPPEELALIGAVDALAANVETYLAAEDFAGAMGELAKLRAPVDAFFDKVLVNSDVPEERDNRLRLLAKVRDAMGRVADFSQVTG